MSFHVAFHQMERTDFWASDSRDINLRAHWCPPLLLRWINWVTNRLFETDEHRKVEAVKVITVDQTDVCRAISKNQQLMNMIYDYRCKTVIVGPTQLNMLREKNERLGVPLRNAHWWP